MKQKIGIFLLASVFIQPSFLLASDDGSPVSNWQEHAAEDQTLQVENIVRVNSKILHINSIKTAMEFERIPRVPVMFEPLCRSFQMELIFPTYRSDVSVEFEAKTQESNHSYNVDFSHIPINLFCQMKPMKFYINLNLEVPGIGSTDFEFEVKSTSWYPYYGYSFSTAEGELDQDYMNRCSVSDGNKVKCKIVTDGIKNATNNKSKINKIRNVFSTSQIDDFFKNGFTLEIE